MSSTMSQENESDKSKQKPCENCGFRHGGHCYRIFYEPVMHYEHLPKSISLIGLVCIYKSFVKTPAFALNSSSDSVLTIKHERRKENLSSAGALSNCIENNSSSF